MKTFADFFTAGNIPEDVINAIFQITPINRPYTGTIAHEGALSAIPEWLDKALAVPNKDNAIIDGADSADDSTDEATRYRNPCQLTDRGIRLGDQAQASDSFANIADFEKQLEDRVNETYRDQEASALSENASVIPTNAVAAKQAGFFAQCKTATSFGTTGADGGWNSGTGVFDAPTPGTIRALSEDNLLTVMATANRNGANLDTMMMITELKRQFSSFMMSSSSRIGVLVTQAPGGEGGATAVQSVMTYETDYGVVRVIGNKIMQPEVSTPGSERTNVAIYQSDLNICRDQWTPRAKRLGPTGAGEKWQVTSSFSVEQLNEKSNAAVRDINYTLAMTA